MTLRFNPLLALAMKSAACAVALALLACSAHAQGTAQAAATPFESLDGVWGGNGTITMKNGTNERIRCRVNYMITENGRLLSQDLRCASDSYKFELQTTVAHENGALKGTWNETTRAVVGIISGRISGGEITAVATSSAFTANLAISTRGNQQSVSIRSPGSEVSEVSIALRRGGR
jgi:hypothetical protein